MVERGKDDLALEFSFSRKRDTPADSHHQGTDAAHVILEADAGVDDLLVLSIAVERAPRLQLDEGLETGIKVIQKRARDSDLLLVLLSILP